MTTLQKASRGEFIRQRRTPKAQPANPTKKSGQQPKRAYHMTSVYIPLEPRPVARKVPTNRSTKKQKSNGYNIAFSLGRTGVRAPVLTIPQLGPRWVSAGMTLVLSFLLYTMWTAAPFTVTGAQVRGNQRLGAAEVNAMLGMIGQPIFKAVPAALETNLRTAYSDLKSVSVVVGFPNRITVDVVERTPVIAWYQNGVVTWVDANGVAFTPRGDVPGLVTVTADGAPTQLAMDPALPIYEQKFITPEMIQALSTLAPFVPAGMPMTFDPKYGMGWQDPRGWNVYFGLNTKDIPMKLVVYQSIVDTLTKQGIQPTLISVEYLNAPFYK